VFALHAAGDGAGGVVMTGSGKLGLALVAFTAFGAARGLATARSQDQGSPPAAQSEVPQQQPELPQRVRVAQGVTAGLVVKKVQPKYPGKARENRIQGQVVLHALISNEGDIVSLSAVSGDPLLVKSAVKAVKQWKYKPYLLNGRAVAVDTQILVNFTLSEN
jgi:protein TonB